MTPMTRPAIRAQRGVSLVEVMVCLLILAFSLTGALVSIGSATEDVRDTVDQRKMRYLIQNLLGDIEKGKVMPDDPDEEEQYEEGMQGTFEALAHPDDEEEFQGYEWYIPVFRDEVIVGAPDEETLLDMGFETDDSGNVTGRPVSRDFQGDPELGPEGQPQEPPGQIKRILVFVVRRLGETAEDDREFTIMTYLPYPDEENQQLGAEGEGGEGGGNAGGGAEGGGGGGDARGETSTRGGGGADRGGR